MSIEILDGPREIKRGRGKWRVPIIVAEIVILLAVVIGGILIAANNGMFLSDRDKVLLAISNTLTEDDEMKDFLNRVIALSKNPEYTIGFESEREGDLAFMEYSNMPEGKQLHLETELGGIFDMEITGFLDDSQIKLMHSDVKNAVLVYNYVEENSGYLFQKVLPKEKIKEFNASLAGVYNAGQKSEGSSSNASLEAVAGDYRKLEFEKVGEKSFEIDGASKLCQGYKTVLDKSIGGAIVLEKGTEMTFYINDELLAAVVIKTSEREIEIRFLGGDYRLQNVAVYEEKEAFLELEIKSLDVDTSSVVLDGEARMNWERLEEIDETGALKMLRYAKADGALANRWSDISFTMNDDVDLAKFEGKTLDVGNASLLEMGKNMMDLLMKYAGEWL